MDIFMPDIPVVTEDIAATGIILLTVFKELNFDLEAFRSDEAICELNSEELYATGLWSLKTFLLKSWTSCDPEELISNRDYHVVKQSFGDLFHSQIDFRIPKLEYLILGDICLSKISGNVLDFKQQWWLQRFYFIVQTILRDPSPLLKDKFVQISDDNSTNYDHILFLFESFHWHKLVYEHEKAAAAKIEIEKILGIELQFSSGLGRRTKFQTTKFSQLFVKLERKFEPIEDKPVLHSILPESVPLSDDLLLQKVEIDQTDDDDNQKLKTRLEACFVALCGNYHEFINSSHDPILPEEIEALTRLLLSDDEFLTYGSKSAGLFLRSSWEMTQSARKKERGLFQFESLQKGVSSSKNDDASDDDSTFLAKCQLFWACPPPAPWSIAQAIGAIYSKLGLHKSALDQHLILQDWYHAIQCLKSLGKVSKAEALIREQLELARTPQLLTLLGDCTEDQTHYLEAWSLSKEKYHPAMKALGMWNMHNRPSHPRDWPEAVKCFEKSLALNHLQPDLWFTLGMVSLNLRDWSRGSLAFGRAAELGSSGDNEGYEAWANLATCAIQLGELPKALTALRHALRIKNDSIKLWSNFLLVAAAGRWWPDAIHAMTRLLELEDKNVDTQVLANIVTAYCATPKNDDATNNQGDANFADDKSRQTERVEKLFDLIISKVTSNPQVWRLFARFTLGISPTEDVSIEGLRRRELCADLVGEAAQYQLKCQSHLLLAKDWHKDLASRCKILHATEELVSFLDYMLSFQPEDTKALEQRKNMAINACLDVLKYFSNDIARMERSQDELDMVKLLESKIS